MSHFESERLLNVEFLRETHLIFFFLSFWKTEKFSIFFGEKIRRNFFFSNERVNNEKKKIRTKSRQLFENPRNSDS